MSRMFKERWVGAGVLDAVVLRARRDTVSLLLREKGLEYLMDDLGHGCPVEVCLPADGLEPALFDIKGYALGLAAGIRGRLEGFPSVSLPVDELTQIVEHRLRYPWGDMRHTRGGHAWGRVSRCRQPELFEPLGDGGWGEVKQAGHGALGKPWRVEVAEEGLVVSVTCHTGGSLLRV